MEKRLLDALVSLFKECVMIHRHWGEGCNNTQATAAVAAAKTLIVEAGGTVPE